MNRYQNGKIYKITCIENNLVYYGSTCMPLRKRLSGHRRSYKQFLKGNYDYVTSFDIIKYNTAKIELVEDFKCETKLDLHKREQYYIENNDCVNKCIPAKQKLTNPKEYYQEYRDKNKEKLLKYHKEWRTGNEKYKITLQKADRKYKENNRELLNEKAKKHYLKVKHKLSEKHNCECGGCYTNKHKNEHLRTKKHLKYIASLS